MYGFRAVGPANASAVITRISDHPNGLSTGARNLTQAQHDAYTQAKRLIQRNNAGDREQARQLLAAQFDTVFDE